MTCVYVCVGYFCCHNKNDCSLIPSMFIDRVAEWGDIGRHSGSHFEFWSLGAEAGGMYILDLPGLYSDKNTDRGGAQEKK